MHCLDFLVINYSAAMKLIQSVSNNYLHLPFYSLGLYYFYTHNLLLYLVCDREQILLLFWIQSIAWNNWSGVRKADKYSSSCIACYLHFPLNFAHIFHYSTISTSPSQKVYQIWWPVEHPVHEEYTEETLDIVSTLQKSPMPLSRLAWSSYPRTMQCTSFPKAKHALSRGTKHYHYWE